MPILYLVQFLNDWLRPNRKYAHTAPGVGLLIAMLISIAEWALVIWLSIAYTPWIFVACVILVLVLDRWMGGFYGPTNI
jgi:hypothetical protein